MISDELDAAILAHDAGEDGAMEVINGILRSETDKLITANNTLVDLAERRPRCLVDDVDVWRNDEEKLLEFAAICQPLYVAIADHSGNVAVALAAILRNAGWRGVADVNLNSGDADTSSDGEQSGGDEIEMVARNRGDLR